MLTGVHVVRDIYCISCQSNVGWKYVRPHALPRLPPSLARSCTSSAEDEMFVRAFVFSAQVTAYEESHATLRFGRALKTVKTTATAKANATTKERARAKAKVMAKALAKATAGHGQGKSQSQAQRPRPSQRLKPRPRLTRRPLRLQ